MCCEDHASSKGSDRLEAGNHSRPFEGSAAAWLLGQAVRALNTSDKEGEQAYARAVDVLRHCGGSDVLDTVRGLVKQLRGGDSSLRWNLLYVLGDSGDASAADFLVRTALSPLPDVREAVGCETERDMEMLVATGAVLALKNVATRHQEVAEHLLKVVGERPARPILIEAIKAAGELGLREKVQHILPKDDHWMLDIRRARVQELDANPERENGKERSFTPPKSGSLYTAPHVGCCAERK